MSRRKFIGTSILLLTLLGFCIYLNRDWFAGPGIQIYHRDNTRPSAYSRGRGAAQSKVNPVLFGFNRSLKLKSVRVVSVAELATNKYAHSYWELVTSSNSIPLRGFEYGQWIRGMQPKVSNARPEPLEPDVTYRLLLETTTGDGEHDFAPTAKIAP